MLIRPPVRALLAGLVCSPLIISNASAAVTFNEGHDDVFVSGTLASSYDSNISASSLGKSDFITSATLALEYARHAGIIGIDGGLSWTHADFATNIAQGFSDPTMSLDLTKKTGRTTGALTLSAGRQSKADTAINQRTVSWNYNLGFNWKYPVMDRYSLAGTLGYGILDYTGTSTNLTNLTTTSAGTDLLYAISSQRDLLAGYRIRQSETSTNTQSVDHAITTGLTGKISPKLTGSVRAGYQIRQESTSGQSFGSTTASTALTWAASKRIAVIATIEKDFNTTATGGSVDNLSFNLDAQYTLTYQWALIGGVGTGSSNFLNGADLNRKDYYASWHTGVRYTINDHFNASLSYSYLVNWSNQSIACYDRNLMTINLTTRW